MNNSENNVIYASKVGLEEYIVIPVLAIFLYFGFALFVENFVLQMLIGLIISLRVYVYLRYDLKKIKFTTSGLEFINPIWKKKRSYSYSEVKFVHLIDRTYNIHSSISIIIEFKEKRFLFLKNRVVFRVHDIALAKKMITILRDEYSVWAEVAPELLRKN